MKNIRYFKYCSTIYRVYPDNTWDVLEDRRWTKGHVGAVWTAEDTRLCREIFEKDMFMELL